MTSKTNALEWDRSHTALACVRWDGSRLAAAERAEFLRAARRFPIDVRQTGLGQALAMLRSRDRVGTWTLYGRLQTWMKAECKLSPYFGAAHDADLSLLVRQGSRRDYMRAATQAARYAVWLNRWAEALWDIGTPPRATAPEMEQNRDRIKAVNAAGSTLPLYQGAQAWNNHGNGNAGLWYSKFCDTWLPDLTGFPKPTNDNPDVGKIAWLNWIAPGNVGEATMLEERANRTRDYVKSLGGVVVDATTAEMFVTGKGESHPLENGFAWEHSLGVPYLPGSGAKGVAQTWIRDWSNQKITQHENDAIFGSQEQAGSCVFLPVMPIAPVPLVIDGTTPHQSDYHDDDRGTVAPADYHGPKPIQWLAVGPGARFQAAVVPRRGCVVTISVLEKVAGWLASALRTFGAGAMTSIDHGRFDATVKAQP